VSHGLSGSKMDLAAHCLYWAREDVTRPSRPMGKAARIGVRVHKMAELHIKGAQEECPGVELEDAHEEAEARALWPSLRTWIAQGPWEGAELPLLYDAATDTASVCGVGDGARDYQDVTGMRLPMRLDLMSYEGGVLEVWDIKTGKSTNLSPAAESHQLLSQALAAHRHHRALGRPKPHTIRIGFVVPMKTKCKDENCAVVSPEALDAHALHTRRTLLRLPMATPNKGEHCWRCPCGPSKGFLATCPAWADEEQKESAA